MIRRRSALAVASALALTACARSEPIAVPAEVRDVVASLVGVDVPMTGETCAALPVDSPTEGNHRYRGKAGLTGDPQELLDALRAEAIGQGWQPQRAPGPDLALAGPEPGMQLAATSTASGVDVEVLVEHRCSSPSPLFRGDTPALTDEQREVLTALTDAVTELQLAVHNAFSDAPTPWAEVEATRTTCRSDGRAGVRWQPRLVPDIPVSTPDGAAAAITAAAPPRWTVESSAPVQNDKGVTTADFVASARIEGYAIEVPMAVLTFTTGSTTLFIRATEACVPPARPGR